MRQKATKKISPRGAWGGQQKKQRRADTDQTGREMKQKDIGELRKKNDGDRRGKNMREEFLKGQKELLVRLKGTETKGVLL